jgi:hypothetical protein
MKLERDITPKGHYNVVVVGGGIAGVAAALSAVRAGASVLLLEKSINLGGLATGGLISWYEPLCDGKGRQMIHGIAEELIRLASRVGFNNLPAAWGGDGKNAHRDGRFSSYYSPTVFSLALDRLVRENGVVLRPDSLAVTPLLQGTRCVGVAVESACGCELFEADTVVDATGDASMFHRAGLPTVDGENYFTYVAHAMTRKGLARYLEDGDLCRYRQWINVGSNLYGNGHPEGMKRPAGTTAEEIAEFLAIGKDRMLARIEEGEGEIAELWSIPTMPQFRTIRRIVGNTDFEGVDGKKYADAIGECSDFRPKGIGMHFEIPLGALWHKDCTNLLAAGRIISAPQGDPWEITRVIPVCALTGEAAGRAAAICALSGRTLAELNAEDVQKIKIHAD